MEKDIGRIKKNNDTDIVVRVDDFGGKIGVTIREFTNSERYKGFTKAGTRIVAENFQEFKDMINSISLDGLQPSAEAIAKAEAFKMSKTSSPQRTFNNNPKKPADVSEEDYM